MAPEPTRRGFLWRAVAAGAAVVARRVAEIWPRATLGALAAGGCSDAAERRAALTHGPFLGSLSPSGVSVWARSTEPGRLILVARGGDREVTGTAEAVADRDQTLVWQLSGLEPGTEYRYEIRQGNRTIFSRPDATFLTPQPYEMPSVVRLAVGSCAREEEGDRSVWRRMRSLEPEAVVLLGDTPYIDSTDLAVQRKRYGEFAAVEEFADLLRGRPLFATWDDHDFGRNDTDGRLDGKETSRRAFLEFHANPSYGDGREGVYTKFRLGGVEVFLLDTRYFAGTAQSPIGEGPTMLGAAQWAWLSEGLRASDAPFKILASGLVWNGAVRPGKPDHWESYAAERDALFRFLGDEGISGVVLVGGDVHRTRVLRYDTQDVVGYPLTELITSPMHDGVIDDADAPHPALVFDAGEPHAFMLVTVDTTVDPPTLRAEFQNAAGRSLYSLSLSADALAQA